MARLTSQQRINLTILVAALGYFVDVFDIQLFGILRVTSLKSLGLTPEEITTVGAQLLNWQMGGMLLGGILWGIYGDKKGRVQVLFGTIFLYSIANIANAFVTNIPEYAAARFFSGLGLAGEIGAGVTLASELLPKNIRGYATTFVLCIGVSGPVFASYVVNAFDWRMAFAVGGILGLLLLLFRISVNESGMFASIKTDAQIARGKLRMLFNNRKRCLRYLGCIALGIPTWYVLGVIIIFSPEIGSALKIAAPINPSTAVMSYFVGSTLGNLTSGLFSQIFKTRKKVLAVFLFGSAATCAAILHASGINAPGFYGLTMISGLFVTFPLFMTITPEMFGTNLRATAATTAPNFVRASVIPSTILISWIKPDFGFLGSVQIIGVLCFAGAAIALLRLPETFGRDLDFIER